MPINASLIDIGTSDILPIVDANRTTSYAAPRGRPDLLYRCGAVFVHLFNSAGGRAGGQMDVG